MPDRLHSLRTLIDFASAQAEKLFRIQGAIYPLYHCIRPDGENVVLNRMPGDKDLSVALMKAWMRLNDIDRYVFFDEAWIVDDRHGHLGLNMETIQREGISKHPDRREVVMFSAESRDGKMLMARRYILRPEIGRPKLSPLVIDEQFEHSEGRMVGLLQWDKQK